jgi:hypothetical protein
MKISRACKKHVERQKIFSMVRPNNGKGPWPQENKQTLSPLRNNLYY